MSVNEYNLGFNQNSLYSGKIKIKQHAVTIKTYINQNFLWLKFLLINK